MEVTPLQTGLPPTGRDRGPGLLPFYLRLQVQNLLEMVLAVGRLRNLLSSLIACNIFVSLNRTRPWRVKVTFH